MYTNKGERNIQKLFLTNDRNKLLGINLRIMDFLSPLSLSYYFRYSIQVKNLNCFKIFDDGNYMNKGALIESVMTALANKLSNIIPILTRKKEIKMKFILEYLMMINFVISHNISLEKKKGLIFLVKKRFGIMSVFLLEVKKNIKIILLFPVKIFLRNRKIFLKN